MAKIAIIVGHSMRDTFGEAIGNAYRRGAESGGHKVALFVLGEMRFDPILRAGYREEQPLEPDLAAARAALGECDHWVIVFPLWCGDMPAILKGFIERTLQPDLLAAERTGTLNAMRIFEGKSARVIVTMGMPALVYRWYFGAHALKLLRRNILQFMGVKPVRETVLGMVGNGPSAKRERWLREAAELGRAAK